MDLGMLSTACCWVSVRAHGHERSIKETREPDESEMAIYYRQMLTYGVPVNNNSTCQEPRQFQVRSEAVKKSRGRGFQPLRLNAAAGSPCHDFRFRGMDVLGCGPRPRGVCRVSAVWGTAETRQTQRSPARFPDNVVGKSNTCRIFLAFPSAGIIIPEPQSGMAHIRPGFSHNPPRKIIEGVETSIRNMSEPLANAGSALRVDWQAELDRHRRWLRTVVLARAGEPQAVDEIMQEVALAAVTQKSPIRDVGRIAPWLYQLAVRQSLMYRRKLGRKRRLEQRYAERAGGVTQPTQSLDPLSVAVSRRTAATNSPSGTAAQTARCGDSVTQVYGRLELPGDSRPSRD